MPSSDGKKLMNLKKNLGVSVKRKSSTSPSALHHSPTIKKKKQSADQQNSMTIKSSLCSYNLRSSHLSKSAISDDVPLFNNKSKDEKHLNGTRNKASSRCSFCSHFIAANSSSFVCFRCRFKYSEPKDYKNSRSVSLRSANNLSDEPEVVAVVPQNKEKEILVVYGRSRRKCTARLKDSSEIANGETQMEESKPVTVKMVSESEDDGKKSVESAPTRRSKRAKYLNMTKVVAETADKSVLNPKAAEMKSQVVTRSKRLSAVLKESLFLSTKAINMKQRSTSTSDNHAKRCSSDNHAKSCSSGNPAEMLSFVDPRTEDRKKTVKSPTVKRKRKTYECDRCGKSFTHGQRFNIHHRKCVPSIVPINEDSESTLSNYSGMEFGGDLENLALNGSDNMGKNVTISSLFYNAPSESTDEVNGIIQNVDFSRKISSEGTDPSSSQTKVGEVMTNGESFSLPNVKSSLDIAETFSEDTESCCDVLQTFLDAKTSSLKPNKACLETNEQCSNQKDFCLEASEPSLDATEHSDTNQCSLDAFEPDATESSFNATELSLDGKEPSLDATELSLDVTEPSLDATEPSLDTTKPSLDATEPLLDATEPPLDVAEPSLDATEPSLDATEPSLDVAEPSLDATEQSLNANEPSLDANDLLDATKSSLDATAPTLEAHELFLDAIDTSLNNTQPSLDVPKQLFVTTEHCLDAIEPSLDAAGSCMYLEESFLNPEVSSLGATVQISDTKDNNVAEPDLEITESSLDSTEHALESKEPSLNVTEPSLNVTEPSLNATELSLNATEPNLQVAKSFLDVTFPSLNATRPSLDVTEHSLDVTQPSLDATATCLDTMAPSLNVNEDCTNAAESCMGVTTSDLKAKEVLMDASKTESAADGSTNSLKLQNCCLVKGLETSFKEKEPSSERMTPSLKVPELSGQDPKPFLKGEDSCLMELECNSKKIESNGGEYSSTLHDPSIGLEFSKEGLSKTQFRMPEIKESMEVSTAAKEPVPNETKSILKGAEPIVEESLKKDSNLDGNKKNSNETELNVKQQITNLNGEEPTLKQKENCVEKVGNHLQGTESYEEAAKIHLEGQNKHKKNSISQEEEINVSEKEGGVSPLISLVFSVSESDTTVEPEENALNSFTNDQNAGPYNLSRDGADNSHSARMASCDSFISEELPNPVPPKWENCGLRKGKRKPEDSTRGKEPATSRLPSSNNRSHNGRGMPGACRSCGNPLSFPAPTDNSTKACVVARNICFSSATVCQYCFTHQNIQFSLATKTINDMYNYHLSNFINRDNRMTHRNLRRMRLNSPANASYAQVDTPSNGIGSQTSNLADLFSTDSGNLDSFRNFPCTPPSTLSMPPSPFSCASSFEGQTATEQGQVAPELPREITLTENMSKDFDVYSRGTEDKFLCMRFKDEACVQPLRRRDIAMHYFLNHDSPADRSVFNLLHVDE